MSEATSADGRPPLSYERIIAAAVSLIDEAALTALTMRSLGDVLGVEAMSLYRYVAGKDRLLYAVAEQLLVEALDNQAAHDASPERWQDFLLRLAHSIRRVAIAHPRGFFLVATLPTDAPWLRPPLRTASSLDAFLRSLSAQGFSDKAAMEAYQDFTAFLIGHLLLEIAEPRAPQHSIDSAAGRRDPGGADYPHIRRLHAHMSADVTETRFDQNLSGLIDSLSTRLAA